MPGAVIGGWQLSGIVNMQSGVRVNPSEGQPQFLGAANIEPVLAHDPNLPASQRTLSRWFDTSAFTQPGPNQYGSNSAIYSIRAPSLQNYDVAFSKFFKIREGHRIQVRGEFFNVLNHANFGAPGATRGTATFGRISSAGPAREGQVAVKYQF